MDGFTLVEQLQQAPQPHQIPVILLKAKTLTAGDQAVLERSVRTVIQKRGLDDDTVIQELLGLLQAYRVSLPKDFVPPFARLNGGRRSSGLQHPPASSVWMDVSHRSP